MSIAAMKTDTTTPASAKAVKSLQTRVTARLGLMLRATAVTVIPPLITLAVLLMIWQIAFGRPGATLPPPTQVWSEAKDLILDPFFINGSQDIGLGWRVLTSLQRVVVGFSLSAVVGVLLGAVGLGP